MGFAEAEQTDRAVSAASDISWTYSLDLVDSLKLAGPFPARFEERAPPHRRQKKVMAREQIVKVSKIKKRNDCDKMQKT